MNNFEKSEEQGRKIFKDYLDTIATSVENYAENDDPYGHWDVAFTVNSKNYTVELKHRNYTHNHFSTWMLEEYKYKKLNDIAEAVKVEKDLDVEVLYVNTFKDKKIRVWNLSKIDVESYTKKTETHVKTTAEDNGKRQKSVIHLPNHVSKVR